MANISSIIWSLMMVEMIALLLCLLAVMVFLRGTFLKRLNARQEVRAEEYLFMIDRTVSFQFRGFADFAAISLIFINLIPNVFVILDSSPERHSQKKGRFTQRGLREDSLSFVTLPQQKSKPKEFDA